MMKIVDKDSEDLLQDEGIIVIASNESLSLMFRCPKCNQVTITGGHSYNRETNSITPSVVHTCGFHKTLTNGIWH